MKTLVLGANGQLGQTLVKSAPADTDVTALSSSALDVTDAGKVLKRVREIQPDLIINAAAYTAVDKAEAEADIAGAVNHYGAGHVALAAAAVGARLIHISTDFVFDGASSTPYTTTDATNPLNVYGQSKLDGERAVAAAAGDRAVIVRTSWLYSQYGHNFVKTMLRLMRERDSLSVVADQIGSPTWCESLATVIWALADAPAASGVYHWSDGGQTSWYDFARAIQDEALALGLLQQAIPIQTTTAKDYATPAVRPVFSALDSSRVIESLNIEQENWRVRLREMLATLD